MKATLFAIFALAALTANATTIFFNSPTGTLGASQSYSGITVYGFSNVATPTDLFGKNNGGDENGVGLAGFPDNEIEGLGFIQISVGGLTGISLEFNSTTDGEHWKVSQSNVLGQVGTSLLIGGDEGVFHAVSPTMSYLTVQATGGYSPNVLLEAMIETAPKISGVPEPNAAWFVVAGLALIIAARYRQWRLSR